jgi:hypothetical protein
VTVTVAGETSTVTVRPWASVWDKANLDDSNPVQRAEARALIITQNIMPALSGYRGGKKVGARKKGRVIPHLEWDQLEIVPGDRYVPVKGVSARATRERLEVATAAAVPVMTSRSPSGIVVTAPDNAEILRRMAPTPCKHVEGQTFCEYHGYI